MLANLMPPRTAVRVKAVDVVTASLPSRGRLVVHPRYRQWLHRHGLTSAESILAQRGEIVSGHTDRNVSRIELGSRVVYLKREHRVGALTKVRNWRDGCGYVSRSEREATLLQDMEAQSLPVPQWIAYGRDAKGKAFLLIDDLAGTVELRQARFDHAMPQRIADAVADTHAAGYDTPDLCAKHVYIHEDSQRVTLLDWPSTRKRDVVSLESRVRCWGQLDASLRDDLATPRQRLRTLWRYWKRFYLQIPEFRIFLEMVESASRNAMARSSIQDQRCPAQLQSNQRLVWLADDEQACVTPGMATCWPVTPVCRPYYPRRGEFIHNGTPLVMNAPDGEPATLRRWRTTAPFGRLIALLRSRSWRSPASKRARYLFHCQRHGYAAPTLLAFGQRVTGPFTVESFVLERT